MSNYKKPKVLLPKILIDNSYCGDIWGVYQEESNIYHIIYNSESNNIDNCSVIGKIITDLDQSDVSNGLIGIRRKNSINFVVNTEECEIEIYEMIQNIFSRNTGIIESNLMLRKRAIISGCGSVGSFVAVELAKAGVGFFFLIDNDILSHHNLCRHQCGLQDIGRYKVNALRDKILQFNPLAVIETSISIIEDVEKNVFDEICDSDAILVGCADNREGDIYASQISAIYKIPFVSIGLWKRAFAGEVFYSIPGEMPCYHCVFNNHEKSVSNRVSQSRRFYLNEEELEKQDFEPGISADITFVSVIGVKLIIDLLNLNSKDYIFKLIKSLKQFTLICNSNEINFGGELAEIFAYPLQVTSSIDVSYSLDCPPCRFI